MVAVVMFDGHRSISTTIPPLTPHHHPNPTTTPHRHAHRGAALRPGAEAGRVRVEQGEGLRGRHEALELCGPGRLPRRLRHAPLAGLHGAEHGACGPSAMGIPIRHCGCCVVYAYICLRRPPSTPQHHHTHSQPLSPNQHPQSPGRVFKGKKMPGRLGGERVTVQSLWVSTRMRAHTTGRPPPRPNPLHLFIGHTKHTHTKTNSCTRSTRRRTCSTSRGKCRAPRAPTSA